MRLTGKHLITKAFDDLVLILGQQCMPSHHVLHFSHDPSHPHSLLFKVKKKKNHQMDPSGPCLILRGIYTLLKAQRGLYWLSIFSFYLIHVLLYLMNDYNSQTVTGNFSHFQVLVPVRFHVSKFKVLCSLGFWHGTVVGIRINMSLNTSLLHYILREILFLF